MSITDQELSLGSVPASEDCAQIPAETARNRAECAILVRQLERAFPIPAGLSARFAIKACPHDFGTYREVVVRYRAEDPDALAFALDVESRFPEHWDLEAAGELVDWARVQARS